jgi:hypothetical protein
LAGRAGAETARGVAGDRYDERGGEHRSRNQDHVLLQVRDGRPDRRVRHVRQRDVSAAIWSTELSGNIGSLERIAEGRVTRGLSREERKTFGIGG